MFELPTAVDQSTFRVMLSGEIGRTQKRHLSRFKVNFVGAHERGDQLLLQPLSSQGLDNGGVIIAKS